MMYVFIIKLNQLYDLLMSKLNNENPQSPYLYRLRNKVVCLFLLYVLTCYIILTLIQVSFYFQGQWYVSAKNIQSESEESDIDNREKNQVNGPKEVNFINQIHNKQLDKQNESLHLTQQSLTYDYTPQQIKQFQSTPQPFQIYQQKPQIFGITEQMHKQSINWMQLSNSKFYLNPFDQEKYIIQETQYYNSKYKLQEFIITQKQLKFCIIVTGYNWERLPRNMLSVLRQDYGNWSVIYVNDNKDIGLKEKVFEVMKAEFTLQQANKLSQKIKIVQNAERLYALRNIYGAIHNQCDEKDIVLLIDGDDALIGRQVLKLLNHQYQQPITPTLPDSKPLLVYSKYLHIQNSTVSLGMVSRPIRPGKFIKNRLREEKVFYTSHLLTFKAGLFHKIKEQELKDHQGKFYKIAYDVSIALPMLQMAYPYVMYLPEILYEYHYDGKDNDNRKQQDKVALQIYSKKPYERLQKKEVSKLF